MENPIRMDDLGVPLLSETSKWWFINPFKGRPFIALGGICKMILCGDDHPTFNEGESL